MGSRGHSTEDIHTPLGLDMGTWGLGDMGSRGHSTEDIHTFRVRHGDMGTQVGKGTWGLGLHTGKEGDMAFRVRHGDIHHMGTGV